MGRKAARARLTWRVVSRRVGPKKTRELKLSALPGCFALTLPKHTSIPQYHMASILLRTCACTLAQCWHGVKTRGLKTRGLIELLHTDPSTHTTIPPYHMPSHPSRTCASALTTQCLCSIRHQCRHFQKNGGMVVWWYTSDDPVVTVATRVAVPLVCGAPSVTPYVIVLSYTRTLFDELRPISKKQHTTIPPYHMSSHLSRTSYSIQTPSMSHYNYV